MEQKIPDPSDFVALYGDDAMVVTNEGGTPITLGYALQVEKMFCAADDSDRLDPIKRVGFLARILADGGSLRPEHEHLISRPE